MRIYRIAVFTGDLDTPIRRDEVQSLTSLYEYLSDKDPAAECSAIIKEFDHTGNKTAERIFFGTKEQLLKQEDPLYAGFRND